jgi:hypothetical protein
LRPTDPTSQILDQKILNLYKEIIFKNNELAKVTKTTIICITVRKHCNEN